MYFVKLLASISEVPTHDCKSAEQKGSFSESWLSDSLSSDLLQGLGNLV
jgi:hypothetical protein